MARIVWLELYWDVYSNKKEEIEDVLQSSGSECF